jgi:hypothetical protein
VHCIYVGFAAGDVLKLMRLLVYASAVRVAFELFRDEVLAKRWDLAVVVIKVKQVLDG